MHLKETLTESTSPDLLGWCAACAYYESGAFFAPAYSTEFGGALPESGAPYDPDGYETS